MRLPRILTALGLLAAVTTQARATGTVSGSVTVNGTANIYGAGHTYTPAGSDWYPFLYGPTLPSGTLPPYISLAAGTGRTLHFDLVTGTWGCCGGANTGPAGYSGSWTHVSAAAGISRIDFPSQMFLAGVFLSGDEPVAGTEPDAYGEYSSLVSPELQQVFYIGDGFTGIVGTTFRVPDAATRLFLGVADSYAFSGPPSFYNDNPGSVTARYAMEGDFTPTGSVAPEPGTVVLLATGLAGLATGLRRRRVA